MIALTTKFVHSQRSVGGRGCARANSLLHLTSVYPNKNRIGRSAAITLFVCDSKLSVLVKKNQTCNEGGAPIKLGTKRTLANALSGLDFAQSFVFDGRM